jgi:hypothetical protein
MPTAPVAMVQVSGSILDRDGAGLRVAIRFYGYGRGIRTEDYETLTDASGAFTKDLPEGRYDVEVVPPFGSGFSRAYLRVSITPHSRRIDYRYSGILIQGTVLSPSGAPVDTGEVLFNGPSGPYSHGSFRNGAFKVLVPGPGTYGLLLYSWSPEFRSKEGRSITVTSDTVVVLNIADAAVIGTIFGPNGIGLEGARIEPGPPEIYSSVRSGPGGAYELWVSDGDYRFRVWPPSDMQFVLPRITPLVAVSGVTNFDASLAGARWSGSVRSSADSSAIPNALVTVRITDPFYGRSARDLTGMDGAFEIILEPGREYDISITGSSLPREFWVRGIVAGADSTFDLYVEVSPPTP